ncbi:MAG: restriction endonuclease [Chloroflexota bacterium]
MADLSHALEQFDAVDENLRRLDAIWQEMRGLVPDGIAFVGGSPEDRRYRELGQAFEGIATALPALSGYRITARPLSLDAIGQARFDVAELGELSARVSLDEEVGQPGVEIDHYRGRLQRTRRQLVREHVERISAQVDRDLGALIGRFTETGREDGPEWDSLAGALEELDRLVGPLAPRGKAWSDMRRHVRFRQAQDMADIQRRDWPDIRRALQDNLYSELDPLPVDADDLGDLVAARPKGRVTTALDWSSLSAEAFERLIFELLRDAPGYENPQWLTATNAPDRGRDLSADLVRTDVLTGTRRERVIVQAKHWLARSVNVDALAEVSAYMTLWGDPPVDVLVIATSGRFTTDAVQWVESHNARGVRPHIEMWPEAHLEGLIATRPHIAAAIGLRHREAPADTAAGD